MHSTKAPLSESAFISWSSRLKGRMKSKTFFPLLTMVLVFAAIAADKPSGSGVIHLEHDKVAAMFAQGGPLLATNNFKVLALRREAPGEVEVHDQDTDIFYVLEGSATFVTGGKPIDSRTSAPGETRAKTIAGGDERRLNKGDVLVIPNGVPHWFKEVSGPFLYYVVKVSRS
jgi:glc operon protein GlcG